MKHAEADLSDVLPAKQARSRATRDALVRAGKKLCEIKDFDELSVAEIAAAAGCSVGSFYSRFTDKDGFFRALVGDAAERDKTATPPPPADPKQPIDDILAEVVAATLASYRKRRGLIRATIRRSMTEPALWEPSRKRGQEIANRLVARLAHTAPGDPHLERRVRFAFQMLYGTLNNAVLIAPGPLQLEDEALEGELLRAFRLMILTR
ncbi:TetR family transcriptional regulator [Afipia sp. P52-10]|nr:TetR family transcriptional regulator [Afipia sp. P52-10]